MSRKPARLAVITSGGDAPGMNAAIRAVVRSALYNKVEVLGVRAGLGGLIHGDFFSLDLRGMANIIQRGGTILKTGRSVEFLNAEVRSAAAVQLKKAGVEALVCIGGDGSFRGMQALGEEHKISYVGVPATIDNDIYGTDRTIGFDTAVNTALEAIDRIRDTAASHDRLFIVEVMGRDSGFIAADVGLAGGAEVIFVPESPIPLDTAILKIQASQKSGKQSSILVTAEGQKPGRAYDLAESIRKKTGIDAKVCILGHIQRGGAPTAADRILASQLGAASVTALCEGKSQVMVGVQGSQIVSVPMSQVVTHKKQPSREFLDLATILSL
jgi:6-phosphofructokinase 1